MPRPNAAPRAGQPRRPPLTGWDTWLVLLIAASAATVLILLL